MTLLRRFLLALLPAVALAQSPAPRIVIDGGFGDWSRVRVSPASQTGGLRDVRITDDSRAVYFLLDFGRQWSLQESSDSTCLLLLDTDANPATGGAEHGLPGVDLVVELSPASGPQGVAARVPGPAPSRLTAYQLGFLSAPTYAAERFELRLARTPARFPAPSLRAKVVWLGASGEVLAESGILRHRLAPRRRPRRPPAAADPLARPPATDFRVLNWNVSGQRLLTSPAPYLNILGALQPDLILLDEVSPQVPVAAVEEFLAQLPASPEAPPWRVLLGSSGYRERSLIATRSPLTAAAAFRSIEFPPAVRDEVLASRPAPFPMLPAVLAGGVPATGAWVELSGRRLLTVALDLVCCATHPGGVEDRIRLTQAAALRAAINQAQRDQPSQAVLVAGDFNLVGLRAPLDTLAQGLDPAGSDLLTVEALDLAGLSNVTWADSSSRYPPGRLDFQLYSASSLRVIHAFVFDSRALPSTWLAAHHLQPSDSAMASDHNPVVADFQWRSSPPPGSKHK